MKTIELMMKIEGRPRRRKPISAIDLNINIDYYLLDVAANHVSGFEVEHARVECKKCKDYIGEDTERNSGLVERVRQPDHSSTNNRRQYGQTCSEGTQALLLILVTNFG
jgi:hypothetical protein